MSASHIRCVECNAHLPSEDSICAHCEKKRLEENAAKDVVTVSAKNVIGRTLVTLFVCILSIFIAWAMYREYHLKSGLEAALYTAASFGFGILVPLFWIFFFGKAVAITIVSMGVGGLALGFFKLTWLSFGALVLLIFGYAFLLYLDKRFPKFFPSKVTKSSPIISIGIWVGIVLFQSSEAVGYIIGGGFILYLTLGSLLAARYPEWGKRIGIKVISPNPTLKRDCKLPPR